jgi:hypothetical protein
MRLRIVLEIPPWKSIWETLLYTLFGICSVYMPPETPAFLTEVFRDSLQYTDKCQDSSRLGYISFLPYTSQYTINQLNYSLVSYSLKHRERRKIDHK